MNYFPFCLFLLCCLAVGACASSKKNDEPSAHDAGAADETAEAPTQAAAPAPGSVQIVAELTGVEETARGFNCKLKIVQVQKYGAGTPPLAEGSELTAMIRHETLASIAPEKQAAEMLAAGTTMNLTLRHQQAPSLGGNASPSWRILTIR